MSVNPTPASPAISDVKELSRRAARSIRHPLARTLLALTFTTGLIDAVSYLGLGHVFTANMTGNVVLLGFGIAGAGGLPVVAPLVSLGAFLLGAGAGGVFGSKMADRQPGYLSYAMVIEASLIAIAVVLVAVLNVRPNALSAYAVITLLALAMGVRNATVRRIGVPDLTTTVLTMTLTGFAADSPAAGGSGAGSTRRAAAVLAMLTGAIAGALLVKSSLVVPLLAAASLALVTGLVYVPAIRAEERRAR
ncbi:MAG TPA: YoaK family protein [Solirubrobacteraceae bacterium]